MVKIKKKLFLSMFFAFLTFPFISSIICNPNLPNGCPETINKNVGGNTTNNYYNNTYITNGSSSIDYTNIFLKNQSNNVAIGFQQNFLDNVSMQPVGTLFTNNRCRYYSFLGSDLCGEDMQFGDFSSWSKYDISPFIGATKPIYYSFLSFPINTTDNGENVGNPTEFDKEINFYDYNESGTSSKAIYSRDMKFGGASTDSFGAGIAGSGNANFIIAYGDLNDNPVWLVQSEMGNYDWAIGNPALPYKTDFYITNGNLSVSDCIEINHQSICSWYDLVSYLPAGGNSSFNQTLTDSLYYLKTNPSNYWNSSSNGFNKTYADTLYKPISFTELPIDLSNTGNVTGALPITSGGTGNYALFSAGIIQSTGGSALISNTTAQSIWDTAYHSNRANLDTIDQNLGTINLGVKHGSMWLNSSSSLGGQVSGLRVDKNVYFNGMFYIGGYNSNVNSFGESGTLTSATPNNNVMFISNINDTTGGQYYGTTHQGVAYTTTPSTFQPNQLDVSIACPNGAKSCNAGNFLVSNGGVPTSAYNIAGTFGAVDSNQSFGNKAIFITSGYVHIQEGSNWNPLHLGTNPNGDLAVKNNIEVGSNLYVDNQVIVNQTKMCLDGITCSHYMTYNGTYTIIT